MFWDLFALTPTLQKQQVGILLNRWCLKQSFGGHTWTGELCLFHFQFSSLIEESVICTPVISVLIQWLCYLWLKSGFCLMKTDCWCQVSSDDPTAKAVFKFQFCIQCDLFTPPVFLKWHQLIVPFFPKLFDVVGDTHSPAWLSHLLLSHEQPVCQVIDFFFLFLLFLILFFPYFKKCELFKLSNAYSPNNVVCNKQLFLTGYLLIPVWSKQLDIHSLNVNGAFYWQIV